MIGLVYHSTIEDRLKYPVPKTADTHESFPVSAMEQAL